MNTEHANPSLFAALAKAQGEIENAAKNAANPHFRSKYADLAEVLNTVRPVFAKHGLSMLQSTGFDGSLVSVTTMVAHADGGYITAVASCVPAKTDAQGIGSATTYLRRYSAAAVAGIAQEDDDGQAAAHSRPPAPVAKVTPTDGVWDAMDASQQIGLQKIAADVADILSDAGLDKNAREANAYARIEREKLDTDEKAALWTLLPSGTRSALKRAAANHSAANYNQQKDAA